MALEYLEDDFDWQGVTDLHFIPQKDRILVRCRKPQGLLSQPDIAPQDYRSFLQKVKLKSGINISEKRLPQDGTIECPKGTFRISTLNGIFGEALTVRHFTQRSRSLEDLGFSPRQLDGLKEAISQGFSLLVITGETGSGKSTTLKALLNYLSAQDKKIVSVEDPVEMTVAGALEVSLNETIGLDYDRAIFAALRQDPDYLAIGEIRGGDTCRHCLKAALSGHPVITTLHSGDFSMAKLRLTALSNMADYVEAVLTMVIQQRLVETGKGRKLVAKIQRKQGGEVVDLC